MTAPTMAPWAAEVDRVLADLRARIPGAQCWHGEYTGSLWGLVRDRAGRAHLVEANDPAELGRRLEAAQGRGDSRPAPRPAAARPARPATVPGAAPPIPTPVLPSGPLPVCRRRRPWWRRALGALIVLEER